MKKAKQPNPDELRTEYKHSDFSGPFERGKYPGLIQESSTVVVLSPDVAEAFPDSEAVNKALRSLIDSGGKSAPPVTRST